MHTSLARAPSSVRLLAGLLVGVLVGVVVGWSSFFAAVLGGWAALAAVFVVWTWAAIAPMDPAETAAHSTSEEPRRAFVTHLVVIAAALFTLVGVAVVLFRNQIGQLLPTVAVLASVLTSWAAIHTVYALRYARIYHVTGGRGIDFHMEEPPRYTDFAYVALTVGMSYAISDTDLGSSLMRRIALTHALLAYLFGTVIIALLVNLVASM